MTGQRLSLKQRGCDGRVELETIHMPGLQVEDFSDAIELMMAWTSSHEERKDLFTAVLRRHLGTRSRTGRRRQRRLDDEDDHPLRCPPVAPRARPGRQRPGDLGRTEAGPGRR